MAQRETFAVVLERARKPRSEGGFGLTMRSESPLERLLDKKNKLDLINAQIKDGRKLTLANLNTFTAGAHRAPEEVHDAIMSATYILVTEHDNTPHQLLALQRLADFPARAEIREQSSKIRAQSAQDLSRLRNQSLAHRTERMQITRAREHRAQAQAERAMAKEKRAEAKAQREVELHTHKIQMDQIRVFLKSKNADIPPQSTHHSSPMTHHLNCPTSTSRDVITDTDAASADTTAQQENPVHLVNPVETQNSKLKTQNSNTASSFLSPAVLANNRLYDQKIDSGEIRLIFAPGKHYEIEYCNPADQPALERLHTSGTLRFFEDPTRTQWLPALRTFGPNPYIPPTATPLNTASLNTEHSSTTPPNEATP